MVQAYCQGWGRFQGRIHGKPEDSVETLDDIPDVSPEEQDLLVEGLITARDTHVRNLMGNPADHA